MANNKEQKKNEKPGLVERLKNFYNGLKSELKRVIWPDAKKTKLNTATVLAIIVGSALLIFIFDQFVQVLLQSTGFYRMNEQAAANGESTAITETVESETTESTAAETTAN